MFEQQYELVGNVKIPEAKKSEVNTMIVQILYKTGIRKTQKLQLAGKEVTVVSVPTEDDNGIISFDYSIFEKKKREISTYNTNTCELQICDSGTSEYGVVMNMIMFLLEAYSETKCYVLCEGKVFDIGGYIAAINSLIGIEISFPHRANPWEMLLFLRQQGCEKITGKEIYNCMNTKCDLINREQLIIVKHIDDEQISEQTMNTEDAETEKAWQLAYEVMAGIVEKGEKEQLREYLKVLLVSTLEQRKQMALREDAYGELAIVAQGVLPAVLIHAYAVICGEKFWDVWNCFGEIGYADIIKIDNNLFPRYGRVPFEFYKVIHRENQDEFLEFGNMEKLILSKEMKERIKMWKENIKSICIPNGMQMEEYLYELIQDLQQNWNCRYIEKRFVLEFLQHMDSKEHARALVMLREMLEEDLYYFPELTRKQAMDWIIRNHRNRHDYIVMDGFQSLMINDKSRSSVLGF